VSLSREAQYKRRETAALGGHIISALLLLFFIMSTDDDEVCANCGISAVDDVNLEECPDCDLVKYCSDKCQGQHRECFGRVMVMTRE